MNNFNGQLNLYPEICIDNFSSDIIFDIRVRAFILTHFHDDHMRNLEDVRFYRLLKENTTHVKFYCSHITRKFIETCDKYSHLTEFCNQIKCETPFLINISTDETVTATFCGSGHCPGSVMVFIEGVRGNVIFTGDFRLPLNCASRLPFFKDTSCSVSKRELVFSSPNKKPSLEYQQKTVDNLYVDMTFFKTEIKCIPTREESVKVLVEFVKKFTKSNDFESCGYFKNLVYMKTSARIGYEYAYQTIYKETGYKVHVNNLIYKIYEKLPDIQSALTVDPYETPIHCCIYENRKRDVAKTDLMTSPFVNKQPDGDTKFAINSRSKVFTGIEAKRPAIPCMLAQNENDPTLSRSLRTNSIKIILSAMWFTDTAGVDNILVEYKPPIKELNTPAYKHYSAVYRLCYSFHSSLEEIVDFVDTIRPKKLFSIALPESTSEQQINEYFYDSNSNFIGFHRVPTNALKRSSSSFLPRSSSDKLVLRKRKSFELKDASSGTSGDSCESEDGLVFGDDSEDEKCKKIKS